MTEKDQIGFDELPESKQTKTIDKAGVHRNFHLEEIEFQVRAKKKEKKKNKETGEMEEIESEKDFVGPWAKFTFKSNDTTEEIVQFTVTLFQPATKEDEIKFFNDKYEKGVAIRKNTVEEQIRAGFNQRFYFYEQLAKAVQIAPDKFLQFKKSIKGSTETLFKDMFDKFFSNFPLERIKTKPIDLKAMWNNNEVKKTSFLQIADPSANNMVFGPYIKDRESMLSVTQYEQKKMGRKFSNNDRAPQTNSTEVNKEGNQWKPIAEDAAVDATAKAGEAPEDDTLF